MIPVFDMHQDLLLHMRERHLFGDTFQTHFSLNETANVKALIATAFPYPPEGDLFHSSVNTLIEEYIDSYNERAESDSDPWRIIRTARDLERVVDGSEEGRGLIISIEGLNRFTGTPDDWEMLSRWHTKGLRSLGIMWNYSNDLGGGTVDTESGTGLSSLGREILEWAEEKGVIVDCAHMNRETFWDAVACTTKPLLVSHGNADTVCPSERNYDDEQLKAIAERDGVIGVFFSAPFLDKQGEASVHSVVEHVRYIKGAIGIRHVGIGSDFGGIISGVPEGLNSIDMIETLWNALEQDGFSRDDIEAVAYKNALRVSAEHLS